jgi:hypothetical protein
VASEKAVVFEILFEDRWDPATATLSTDLVTLIDVEAAIRRSNAERGTDLSARNPANFIKDFLRSQNRNENWPSSLHSHRYSAVQETGSGRAFRFLPYALGQTEPFPDDFVWDPLARRVPVQAVTLPLAARAIERMDEARLMQIVVSLRIMETHFSVLSHVRVLQLEHIQNNVKLSDTEIDGLFQATYAPEPEQRDLAIITVEAKQEHEPVHASQVLAQIRQAATLPVAGSVIIPTIVKGDVGGIRIMEFEAIPRGEAADLDVLTKATEGFYEVLPDLPALSATRKRRRGRQASMTLSGEDAIHEG